MCCSSISLLVVTILIGGFLETVINYKNSVLKTWKVVRVSQFISLEPVKLEFIKTAEIKSFFINTNKGCPRIKGQSGACNSLMQGDIEKSFTVLGSEASFSR